VKTIEQCQKATSQAISRAFDVRIPPDDIDTRHAGRDVRPYIAERAGKPHADLRIADIAALTLSRAATQSGDEALASTLADLIDGGIGIERRALAPRGLDERMNQHRKVRAQKAPLPADLKVKARGDAPRVIRRSGASAVRAPVKVPEAPRVSVGSLVHYRRFDDDSEHRVLIGGPPAGQTLPVTTRSIPSGSPLALALRGGTQGTIVSVILAGVPVELEILSVETQALA
jgi:hypothetical protein